MSPTTVAISDSDIIKKIGAFRGPLQLVTLTLNKRYVTEFRTGNIADPSLSVTDTVYLPLFVLLCFRLCRLSCFHPVSQWVMCFGLHRTASVSHRSPGLAELNVQPRVLLCVLGTFWQGVPVVPPVPQVLGLLYRLEEPPFS